VRIDLWTIGLQAINFLVLAWILGRLFFRPVAQTIADRQAQARSMLADAARARAEAEAEREALNGERARIGVERAEALRQSVLHAAETREALDTQARADAERIRSDAREEMTHARSAEERALQQEASRLAIDIAAKLLERLSPAMDLDGLAERLINGMSALPSVAREEPDPSPHIVTLAAATPLTPPVAKACEDALTRSIGGELDLRIEHDPDLIVGYELRLPAAIIRDNLRTDLERIAAVLAGPTGGHTA
jgi:F-type H+-transporting ATPase subunit b